MLAIVLGAMVIDKAFVLFRRNSKAAISTPNQSTIHIRPAGIFVWLLIESIYDLLNLFKKALCNDGRIPVWVFFALNDHDTIIEWIIE
jgi:hypothetical protein